MEGEHTYFWKYMVNQTEHLKVSTNLKNVKMKELNGRLNERITEH